MGAKNLVTENNLWNPHNSDSLILKEIQMMFDVDKFSTFMQEDVFTWMTSWQLQLKGNTAERCQHKNYSLNIVVTCTGFYHPVQWD